MKFEPKITARPLPEPVAYFDADGDLRIRISKNKRSSIGLCSEDGLVYEGLEWFPNDPDNGQKFYPGDQITITF